jgi:hypothetical protein
MRTKLVGMSRSFDAISAAKSGSDEAFGTIRNEVSAPTCKKKQIFERKVEYDTKHAHYLTKVAAARRESDPLMLVVRYETL